MKPEHYLCKASLSWISPMHRNLCEASATCNKDGRFSRPAVFLALEGSVTAAWRQAESCGNVHTHTHQACERVQWPTKKMNAPNQFKVNGFVASHHAGESSETHKNTHALKHTHVQLPFETLAHSNTHSSTLNTHKLSHRHKHTHRHADGQTLQNTQTVSHQNTLSNPHTPTRAHT